MSLSIYTGIDRAFFRVFFANNSLIEGSRGVDIGYGRAAWASASTHSSYMTTPSISGLLEAENQVGGEGGYLFRLIGRVRLG